MVVSEDPDAFVPCVSYSSQVLCPLYVKYGSKTRTQYFDVKKVAQVVGADKCKALLGLHASQGVTLFIGGAPIGAGDMTPTFRGKGDRGHNLGIIHISHIALITPLH